MDYNKEEIINLLDQGLSGRSIARHTNIGHSTISRITNEIKGETMNRLRRMKKLIRRCPQIKDWASKEGLHIVKSHNQLFGYSGNQTPANTNKVTNTYGVSGLINSGAFITIVYRL